MKPIKKKNTVLLFNDFSFQAIVSCLLLFIKIQAEYHMLCSNLISSALEHILVTSEELSDPELLQEIKSLDLHHFTVPSKPLKSSKSVLTSSKTQKHGFIKNSLFSLFEKKNLREEGNSSFYVDIDNQTKEVDGNNVGESASDRTVNLPSSHVTDVSQSETGDMSHVTDSSQLELLVDLGLDSQSGRMATSSLSVSPCVGGRNSKCYLSKY